ncbi:MAG: hypothetical protein UT69_C0037G0002 [Candidatus Yanofskybacteria bacterium GW2011_GWE1_40_10]|nr:MAG: hypothetical protein UT69_C0037G0002 [Candidatus Yanofskybacteria bacterium GW2011_GWE1_40_10]
MKYFKWILRCLFLSVPIFVGFTVWNFLDWITDKPFDPIIRDLCREYLAFPKGKEHETPS